MPSVRQSLHLTLPTTAMNLAMDEWLLQQSETSEEPREVIRVWQNPVTAVIVGRSSKIQDEVNREFCQRHDIPYLRRPSGGASVVIGPGCLMYAVVLDYRRHPHLRMLDQAHQFVMEKLQAAIGKCGVETQFQGTCDLTLAGRKFSGNSLRCQRNSFLYHGTLLLNFDLDLVQSCLGTPPRQPAYRQQRNHRDFVTNLSVDNQALTQSLFEVWQATSAYSLDDAAIDEIRQLADEKYSSHEWTHKR